ncbi:adenine phosphoribosyltransferase [Pseudonocardia acaciae]|uniref:adenine phosphoribosyltransferase n=1 Tax=Pseudonocardia acaciae TaxID=551276 RepID=UPI00049209E1|nr:adenine phosphoribosyltransferase [Pseudonocardia acaciae]
MTASESFTVSGRLRTVARTYTDFPVPGVQFLDLGPVYADPALRSAVGADIVRRFDGQFDSVLAIDARGIPIGTVVAVSSGRPLLLARKAGKLPGAVDSAAFALEYGEAVLEVQRADLDRAGRVLVVDDVLATGGTAAAALELVRRSVASLAGFAAIVELVHLGGRARLGPSSRVEAVLSLSQ